MTIPFMNLQTQIADLGQDFLDKITTAIKDAKFVGGEEVEKFENYYAEYLSFDHCVSVGNGTDAIEIALSALKLEQNSTVLVPANSFIASAEAVVSLGLKLRFVDCDDDFLINISDLEKKITSDVSAIIAVNLYGKLCNISAIRNLVDEKNIMIVEDCAQSHGMKQENYLELERGDVQCFSFYPGKNLGAFGDGGAICTNDSEIALRCRLIANHGRLKKYDHVQSGRNSRLDSLQALVLRHKLEFLDDWTKRRQEIAKYYFDQLESVTSIQLPKINSLDDHAFHLFVIRVSNRESFISHMKSNGIETGIHYPKSLSSFDFWNIYPEICKKSEQFTSEVVSIPLNDQLTINQQRIIVQALKDY